MAISVTAVGTTFTGTIAATTLALTLTASVPSGALIVFQVGNRSQSGADSVADTSSNTYLAATSALMNNASTSGYNKIWYVQNATALSSGNTITYTLGSSSKASIGAIYATGIATSSALDVVGSLTGSSTSASSTSPTTTINGDLVIALVGFSTGVNTVTPDTTNGWTNTPGLNFPNASGSATTVGEYWVNSGTGTKTFATTSSGSAAWSIVFAAFKPSSSAVTNSNFLIMF